MKRTPLNRVSARRRGETARRRTVVAEVIARDGRRCKAEPLVPEVACWGPLEPDEYDQRAQRPGGHLDLTNVQLLCSAHHRWKTEHEVEAARVGLRPFPRGYLGSDGNPSREMR